MRSIYPQFGYGIIIKQHDTSIIYLAEGSLQSSLENRVYLSDERSAKLRMKYLRETGYFEPGQIPIVQWFDFTMDKQTKAHLEEWLSKTIPDYLEELKDSAREAITAYVRENPYCLDTESWPDILRRATS